MSEKEPDGWMELRLLQDSTMRIWQIYINWFTWSLGLNLLSIGVVASKETIRSDLLKGIAIIMIVALVLSIVVSLIQRSYHLQILERANDLAKTLITRPPNVDLIFGGDVARYTSAAIPITHFAALIGWTVLGYKIFFEGFAV